MNKKRIWLVIPATLLPYCALFALAVILLSGKHPAFGFLIKTIFRGNVVNLLIVLALYCVIAATLSVLCFWVSIHKGWDALSLARSAMIVKLIQVPAYSLIFISGVFLAVTIFTISFTVGLILIDSLTLLLTGLLTAAAATNSVRQGVCQTKEILWVLILQMVFCADVVAAILFYKKLQKLQQGSFPHSK